MELKIIKEEKNPLFDRKEIIAEVSLKSSPKSSEVIHALAQKYSIPAVALRVLKIKGGFGGNDFTITAHIYSSQKERDKYERLTKKEKAAEVKPVEAKSEEEKK